MSSPDLSHPGVVTMRLALGQDLQARSQLLPLLRSPLLGELLAWIFLHRGQAYSVTDLAKGSTRDRSGERSSRGNLQLLQVNSPASGPTTSTETYRRCAT